MLPLNKQQFVYFLNPPVEFCHLFRAHMSRASKKRDLSPYEERSEAPDKRPEAPDKRPEAPDTRPSGGPYTDVMDEGTCIRRDPEDPIQRYGEKLVDGKIVKFVHTPQELLDARESYDKHAANVREKLKRYKNNDRYVWEMRKENPDFAREIEASHKKMNPKKFANLKVGHIFSQAMRLR